jgi:hypothetical protein
VAPDPTVIKRDGDAIMKMTKGVVSDYGYFYASAYSRGRKGREQASRQRHGDHSDLSDLFTERDAESGGALTRYAQDQLSAMADDIKTARDALVRCEARRRSIENRITPEPKTPDPVKAYPHPADAGDLARARDAKQRRESDPARIGEVR